VVGGGGSVGPVVVGGGVFFFMTITILLLSSKVSLSLSLSELRRRNGARHFVLLESNSILIQSKQPLYLLN